MKILGVFDLNNKEDYSNMNKKINDCKKYIDGKLDHFLYEDVDDGIQVSANYDIEDELSPHYIVKPKSDIDKLIDKYPEYERYLEIKGQYPNETRFTIVKKNSTINDEAMFWYRYNPHLSRPGGWYAKYADAPQYTAKDAAKILTYNIRNKSDDWEVIPI